jgi:hypothetical protein
MLVKLKNLGNSCLYQTGSILNKIPYHQLFFYSRIKTIFLFFFFWQVSNSFIFYWLVAQSFNPQNSVFYTYLRWKKNKQHKNSSTLILTLNTKGQAWKNIHISWIFLLWYVIIFKVYSAVIAKKCLSNLKKSVFLIAYL